MEITSFPYPNIVLIGSSIIAILWAITTTEEKKLTQKATMSLFQFIGFCWGIAILALGVYILSSGPRVYWTALPLVIIGLSLMLKPLKDIPWASLVSLLVATLITGILAIYLPPISFMGYDLRWILAIVLLSTLILLYLFLKFIEDFFKVIGIFLSNNPMLFMIGLFGIILGIGSFIL